MSDIFEHLGVSQDASLREIKRAYALKLKTCDQQHDMQCFQELRQAYELACQLAQYRDPRNISELPDGNEALPDLPPRHEPDQHETGNEAGSFPRNVGCSPVPTDDDPIALGRDVQPVVKPFHIDHAAQVIAALKQAINDYPDLDASETLQRFSSATELIPLDERERFEQLLLEWLFEKTVNIKWLDAATNLFVWYTANQHLYAYRYDLAQRVRNHIELRHLIMDRPFDAHIVELGQYYYQISLQHDPRMPPMLIPFAVLTELARILECIESMYPHEVKERFRDELCYWKTEIREQLVSVKAAPASGAPATNKSLLFIPLTVIFYFFVQFGFLSSKQIPQQMPPVVRSPAILPGDQKHYEHCLFEDRDLKQMIVAGVRFNSSFMPECVDRVRTLQIQARIPDKP